MSSSASSASSRLPPSLSLPLSPLSPKSPISGLSPSSPSSSSSDASSSGESVMIGTVLPAPPLPDQLSKEEKQKHKDCAMCRGLDLQQTVEGLLKQFRRPVFMSVADVHPLYTFTIGTGVFVDKCPEIVVAALHKDIGTGLLDDFWNTISSLLTTTTATVTTATTNRTRNANEEGKSGVDTNIVDNNGHGGGKAGSPRIALESWCQEGYIFPKMFLHHFANLRLRVRILQKDVCDRFLGNSRRAYWKWHIQPIAIQLLWSDVHGEFPPSVLASQNLVSMDPIK